jgi:putative transposase
MGGRSKGLSFALNTTHKVPPMVRQTTIKTKGGTLMGRFKKLSHTIYECKYHVVWIPKYRHRVMTGELQQYIASMLKRLCDWKRLEILEMNVQPEHVHLAMDIPPNFAVSQVMGFLKGKTALRIFDKFPQLRKRYWTKHFWSPGYCVSTIGLDEEQICKYVRWQQKKDQENDNQPNLFNQ